MPSPILDRSTIAAALDGDVDALATCAALDPEGGVTDRERVTPALAIAAARTLREVPGTPCDTSHETGPREVPGTPRDPHETGSRAVLREVPGTWRAARRRGVATWLALESDLDATARQLDALGVPWSPLKGVDLNTRSEHQSVYEHPEARPTGDLDLLIPRGALEPARRGLEAAGWRPLAPGPRSLQYLRTEGYAWQAWAPGGALVELHWRLWGSTPEAWADSMLARARRDDSLPPGGRRLDAADAWLVAAHHLYLDAGPRPLGRLLDLVRLVDACIDPSALVDRIVRTASEAGLQLSAVLAAQEAATLWPRSPLRDIAKALAPSLRVPERWVVSRIGERGGWNTSSTRPNPGRVALARLLAGRPSRRGWAALPRRLWPHPGLVERATPNDLAWPRRRALYQWRLLRGRI